MFTHLHLHTDFSLLDGVTKIDDLIEKLKETGMSACAITDHGSMYGVFRFHSLMRKNGLKPIIGCEIYIAPRTRHDKEYGIDNKYYHQTLLAMNQKGYRNLVKIVSEGHMEGFYYKPRVDWETLTKYNEGIIALSGCLQGVIAKPLQDGNGKLARENAKKYAELFKDRFYIEVQKNGLEIQDQVNEKLIEIAREENLPIVATSDVHFLDKEDAEVQEVLWCIADGKTLDDPTRRSLQSDEFYVKTPEEMEELFKDLPEAVENTQKIADRIEDYDISFGRIEPPYDELPEGSTSEEYIREQTYEGCKKIYGEVTKELKERIDYELSVIGEKGYNDYFLVVQMIVQFCRTHDIVVSMRGSGAGSVVAYCLGITSIDPIGWELYFERFLNPERKSAPDFDIDLEDRQRDKVIDFVVEKFGEPNVKQIITFSKLQTRQAIRDVSRVLGIDLVTSDKLSKMVTILFGKSKPIDYMLETNPEFKEITESSEDLQRMVKIVRKITGLARGVSKHACGIVISPEEVTNFVPIQKDSKNSDGLGITQYEFMQLEDVGLMKFDFLGLRNLNVIGNALKKISKAKGIDIDLQHLDPHDKKAFELIRSCETVGIFQMEGEGMRRSIRQINPQTLEDLCYLLAAYRPGPMQFIPEYAAVQAGKKKAEYLLPELEPILSITNGVITYQEQVIRTAVDIAGYTMGEADALRKAMGKKLKDVMAQEKPKFIEGAVAKGFDKGKIKELWALLEKFADYGFPKAHSAMYATVAYWTAYLKANYPLEFMASLLEGDLDNFDRVVIDLEESERLGFKVLPPHINKSRYHFTIEGEDSIRFSLAAIKNVGKEIMKDIVAERDENGDFKSLDDFVSRMMDKKLQLKAIEYLIKSGCMDDFGDREGQIMILANVFERHKKLKQSKELGQIDLFNNGDTNLDEHLFTTEIPPNADTPTHKKLEWEKDLLGLYFSSHPLDNLQEFFIKKNVVSIKDAKDKPNREIVILGVLISNVKRITTKKGQRMAFLTVEDKTGNMDVIVFPKTYEDIRDNFKPNKAVLIAGRVNVRDDEKSIVLEKMKYIDEDKFSDEFHGVTFHINDQKDSEVASLKKIIKQNPGETSVRILLKNEDGLKSVVLKHKIALNPETQGLLEKFS